MGEKTMENDVSKHTSDNIWAWIFQVFEAMDKARKQELSKYNINRSQGSVLSIIHTLGDEATPAQIVQMSFRKINTISEILSRMEKQGLIKKVKDSKNVKIYTAYFHVHENFKDVETLKRRFIEIVGEDGIVSLEIVNSVCGVELTHKGNKLLKEAARKKRISLRKLIGVIITGEEE